MDRAALFVQVVSAPIRDFPNARLKFVVGSAPVLNIESEARIALLVAAAVAAIVFLGARRLVSGVPFLPPADYRSFAVFNRQYFVDLYGEDALPSKAPIEKLEGARWKWAFVQLICLVSLVIVDAVLLVTRVLQNGSYVEEVAELAYWSLFVGLFAFRFYPTPYRPSLFALTLLGSLVPLGLLLQRDIWPRLLLDPPPATIEGARLGWGVYARLALSVLLESCFVFTPRHWYPADPFSDDPVSPEQTAPISNYFSYGWIQGLVITAWGRDIEAKDFPALPDYDKARLWSSKYRKGKKSTVLKTILTLFRVDFIYMTLFSFGIGVLQFIWPISMRELLAYIEKSKPATINPWIWVAGMFIGPIAQAAAFQGYIFNSTRLIVRLKAAFTQALLQKTLKIRFTTDDKMPASGEKGQPAETRSKVGMINNLMSSDLTQVSDAREFFMLVGTVPIEIILSVIFLYDLLGWSSLVGVALMLITMVVPILLARTLAVIQKKLRQSTDARVGLMVEAMNSIRVIKFFGMEQPFLGRIRDRRNKELKLILKSAIYNVGFHTISTILPIINMLVTFGLFTKVMDKPLTASIAFTSISLFDILRSQFLWMAFVSQQLLYAFVSLERIDTFINGEEELERVPEQDEAEADQSPSFSNATLSWCVPGSEDDNNFRLQGINIQCAPGALTVIAGPVGSGKSSFLLGLLGEMRLLKGSYRLSRKNGIAFAAQSPWLQCDSVQNNILFGSKLDQKRYDVVVEACGLTADFEALDAGDQTEIGERGVSLSGGQKARVALARAVYSPAQTILLDDVLSALDAGTAKVVVEKCFKGDILVGRTVVLVTHHLSLVSAVAKKIVVLSDGQVVSEGAPESLDESLIDIIKEDAEEIKAKDLVVADPDIIDSPAEAPVSNGKTKSPAGKLVQDEAYGTGRMPKRLIWEYIKHFGGLAVLVMLAMFITFNNFGSLINQYFVALWTDEYTNHPDTVNVNLWLGLYATVLFGTMLIDVVTTGAWFGFQWIAARKLHDKLVKAVLYSPIRFFDTTSVGRIINRLSNDVKSVDSSIGPYLLQCISQGVEIAMRVAVMSSLIPAFLVPTVIVSIIGLGCGTLYAKAQVGVKRIVSIKESPLMSHFGDSITGILTIRAFSCQERFLDENIKRIDDYSQPNEAFFNLNRWIGMRISWCTAFIGGSAGVIALTSTGYSPGLIGFSMQNALAFSGTVLAGVRYFNALEVELNSYERVDEWVKLPAEETPTPEKEPPAAWPTQGDVRVENLSVRYTKDGPVVLNKINFDVKPRERIGVVGRTGAGKSSLALSLLRFTHISGGYIKINGVDIKAINLEALRRRITIIPQDPVLFSGTVRSNLDPFDETDDTELQVALEDCGLADPCESSDEVSSVLTPTMKTGTKRITLETPVTSGGENLSQGQRQLLAFARGALVRRSKLVILDEATSSTDMKTDERIRELFDTNGNFVDSSFIMIAHRLRTVMPFDRILVLDNKGNGGEVAEFDTPLNLLSDKQGVLYSLAQKSGEFDELLAMAKK